MRFILKLRGWQFLLVLAVPVAAFGQAWYLTAQLIVAFGMWGWWSLAIMRFAKEVEAPDMRVRLANCQEAWPLWAGAFIMLSVSMILSDPPYWIDGIRFGWLMAGGCVLLISHMYLSWQLSRMLALMFGKREGSIWWMMWGVMTIVLIPVFIQRKVNSLHRQVK